MVRKERIGGPGLTLISRWVAVKRVKEGVVVQNLG